MSFPLPAVRLLVYLSLFLWAFLLFVLCIARLSYTTTPREETSLFNGQAFHDPSIVELLISSIFTLAFIPMMWMIFRRKLVHSVFSKAWFEIVILFFLWLFWIGGASAAVTIWPDLSWCVQYGQCRLLQSIMAFAWLGWISITVLLAGNLLIVAARKAWNDEAADTWGSMENTNTTTRYPMAPRNVEMTLQCA